LIISIVGLVWLCRERKYGGETRKELEGYVGFANLPNQVYRKSVKRGFEFTLMVVGKSNTLAWLIRTFVVIVIVVIMQLLQCC
jgi:hypothetical protein